MRKVYHSAFLFNSVLVGNSTKCSTDGIGTILGDEGIIIDLVRVVEDIV